MLLRNIILGVVILIMSCIFVNAINITSTDYDITMFKGINSSFNISFFNDENLSIYDVQIQDINYFEFPVISEAQPNSTIYYPFTAFVNKTIDTNLATKLLWYYRELIMTETEELNVNVTDSGFEPNTISMDANDVLNFHNIDDEQHTISEFDDDFSFNIDPDEVYNFSWEATDTYDVVDETTGFILSLEITNRTEYGLVHYPNKDIPMTFNLVAQYPQSDMNIEIYTSDFNIDYNGYADGVLQITAVNDVYNLNMAMPWTTFSSNNFPLARDQKKIITFRIEPDIELTSETNKTYEFYMNFTSANTPKYSELIKVNVPYIFLGEEDGDSKKQFVYLFDEDACFDFCEKYPDKCPLKTEIKTEILLKEKNITLSEKQITEMQAENIRLRNKIDGLTGELGTLRQQNEKIMENITGDLTYIKGRQDEETSAEEGRNVSVAVIIFAVIILISLLASVIFFKKMMKMRKSRKFRDEGIVL